MPIPSVTEVNEFKEDLDDAEAIVNGSVSVTTRLGGTKESLSQLLAKITHGTITTYSAAATYTDIDDWVEESGIVYRPLPSALPIGPETFDANNWIVVQGYKLGDRLYPAVDGYDEVRALPTGDLTNNTPLYLTDDGISGPGVLSNDATANTITGITQANPAVITYSGTDNWANGDQVYIHGVSGMTEINGTRAVVANLDTGANTFELTGVDSSAYTAYSSGGYVSDDNGGTNIVIDTTWRWRRREEPFLNPKWFGATGDGSTDDTAALQAVVNSVHPTTDGAIIFLPPGTYKVTSQITIPARVWLKGAGMNTTRVNSATGVSPFRIYEATPSNLYDGGGITDISLSLDNAAIGIEVSDVWGVQLDRIRFRDGNTTTGTLIKASGVCFELRVKDCRLVGANNYGIDLINDANSSTIEGCDFGLRDGCTAIRCQDCNHIAIFNNRFEYSGGDAGIKIQLDNSKNTAIYANSIGNANASTGIDFINDSENNQVFGNRFSINGSGSLGISVAGSADHNSITGNSFLVEASTTAAIIIDGRTNTSIVGNGFEFTGSTISEAGVSLKNSASQNIISGNYFRYSPATTGSVGILIASGVLDTVVTSNTFEAMATAINTQANNSSPTQLISNNSFRNNSIDITIGTLASNRITDNIGYVSENAGTSSITSGNTSVAVTNGQAFTPTASKINVVFTENPTNSPGHFWVSSVGATTFTVNVENDPGASNLDFAWSVTS